MLTTIKSAATAARATASAENSSADRHSTLRPAPFVALLKRELSRLEFALDLIALGLDKIGIAASA